MYNTALQPVADLSVEALDELLLTLSTYGNTIDSQTKGGAAHTAALRDVIETFTRLAIEQPDERIAYPLATGLGKTQAAIAWIRTAVRLDTDVSVLVCQEQINSLEDFYRDLIKDCGVPASMVGLLHSNPAHATIKSISPADAGKYPILLVTHARIKGSADAEYLNDYEDGERSIVIWDESLIKSQSRCIAASVVAQSQAAADVIISGDYGPGVDFPTGDLVGYLKRSLRTLKKALHAKSSKVQYMERRTAEQIDEYIVMVSRILKSNEKISAMARDNLVSFLAISQMPLRMVFLGEGDRGDGAITYLLTVPKSFKRIVILDASCGVRELCRRDTGITLRDEFETTAKRFDKLSVTQVVTAGGRSTMGDWRKNSRTVKDYISHIKSLPAHEAVLTVTYKQVKLIDKLKDHLTEAGVDLKETVMVGTLNHSGGKVWKPELRYQFITWGREKAVSKYAYCIHMVALGVLRRDTLELSSQIAGQCEDLTTELSGDRAYVRHVQASEQFYHLQQFIGRGRCRSIINGQSEPATVRVYDQADFSEWVQQGLPGCTWITEKPARRAPVKRKQRVSTKKNLLADAIELHIKGSSEMRLSLRSVKAAVGKDVPAKTFQRARNEAVKRLRHWSVEGQSLVNTAS